MQNVRSGKVLGAEHIVAQFLGTSKSFVGNKSTRYGVANEAVAASSYFDCMHREHANFRLRECGLILDTQHCVVGPSPDCIAEYDCHGLLRLSLLR